MAFSPLTERVDPDVTAVTAAVGYLTNVRTMLRQRALAAGLCDTEDFARSFHILIKGAIIAATEGDDWAGRRAQAMARLLIEQHRQPEFARRPNGTIERESNRLP